MSSPFWILVYQFLKGIKLGDFWGPFHLQSLLVWCHTWTSSVSRCSECLRLRVLLPSCLTFLTLSVYGSGSSCTIRKTTSMEAGKAPKQRSTGLGCSPTLTVQKELNLAPFTLVHSRRWGSRSLAVYVSEVSETCKVLRSKKRKQTDGYRWTEHAVRGSQALAWVQSSAFRA